MALVKKMNLENGITLNSAYSKVDTVFCDNTSIRFSVYIYKDKESRMSNKQPVTIVDYVYKHDTSENSKNTITQAYMYLKTLQEYIGAIDDLEK